MHITNGNYSYKHAANAGLIDNHIFKSDYLISWEQVHLFQYEVKGWVKEWSVDAEIEHECKEDNAMGDLSQEGPNNPSDSADGEVVESFCTKNWRKSRVLWPYMTSMVAYPLPIVMASLKLSVKLCVVVNCESITSWTQSMF